MGLELAQVLAQSDVQRIHGAISLPALMKVSPSTFTFTTASETVSRFPCHCCDLQRSRGRTEHQSNEELRQASAAPAVQMTPLPVIGIALRFALLNLPEERIQPAVSLSTLRPMRFSSAIRLDLPAWSETSTRGGYRLFQGYVLVVSGSLTIAMREFRLWWRRRSAHIGRLRIGAAVQQFVKCPETCVSLRGFPS